MLLRLTLIIIINPSPYTYTSDVCMVIHYLLTDVAQ
jgi:hypothetical protein